MIIKIGIVGYGNLGKGVEIACQNHSDIELIGIFTRRNKDSIKTINNTCVYSVDDLYKYQNKIDVLILCGGSKDDLPLQTPEYAKMFNVIDSFDTHAKILNHFNNVDKSARESKHVALISCGWDPGLFSINRLMMEAILPKGNTYTFWGKGVSQGHSDAIRRIDGVKKAIQYTIPKEEAVKRVRNGENPLFTEKEKHLRECFVVLEENADPLLIERKIKEMPYYFLEYDTIVHFIKEEEFDKNHFKMPHGGFVIRSATTGMDNNKEIMEYSLKLDSNPEFTSNVLITYTKAVYKMFQAKDYGAKTVFDIPPKLLTNKTNEELLKELL